MIRQTTHQLDHSAFAQMDNCLKDNLGELYFHQDMLQSTAGVTNAAGQGVMNWFYSISGEAFGYQHGSWMNGHTDASWNTQFAQSFLFTGRYTDPVSNLTHMDARWYSSDLARFTSPDYYNLQQLALPAGARHQLLPYLGKNYQDLLRDPAQQMRYGYVMGNGLTYLDWLGLKQFICEKGDWLIKIPEEFTQADGAYAAYGAGSAMINTATGQLGDEVVEISNDPNRSFEEIYTGELTGTEIFDKVKVSSQYTRDFTTYNPGVMKDAFTEGTAMSVTIAGDSKGNPLTAVGSFVAKVFAGEAIREAEVPAPFKNYCDSISE